ncbi:MAG: DNA methyltransferase [Candidatus Woesearchaeota archaeon]
MKRHLFLLSQEHPGLARAECEALHPGAEWEPYGKHLLGTVEKPSQRAAYTKRALEVLHQGGADERWPAPPETEGTVKVEVLSLDGEGLRKGEARKRVLDWLGQPRVSLDDPDETFWLVTSEKDILVCKQAWENEEDFEARKNQRRPAPHPTSLPPKLARAMVNLAGPVNHVLDPFCGSGGLLLEASLIGLDATGIDVDDAMLARAKKNLEAYGAEARLVHGDALEHEGGTGCVVTDLPYGRNSKAEELRPLYEGFLKHYGELTERMVVGFPDLVDGEALAQENGWDVKQSFRWPLHKSLSKTITILHRRSSDA